MAPRLHWRYAGAKRLNPNAAEGNNLVAHKFKVGQTVNLMRTSMRAAAVGDYEIRHLMPASDGNPDEPCYRIKSLAERHERVVAEGDLTVSTRHGSIFH